MPERSYTVSEIDRMRTALKWRLDFQYRNNAFDLKDKIRILTVEQELRTYMQAGVDPEDLSVEVHKLVEREGLE